MSIVLEVEDIEKSVGQYVERLERQGLSEDDIDKRVNSYLKNQVVLKYSKEWQDARLQEMIDVILQIPGGYFQIQELINQPHIEFEHHREKNRRSYEKGNVTDVMAKRELTERAYSVYKKFNQFKNGSFTEYDVNFEVTIPKDL